MDVGKKSLINNKQKALHTDSFGLECTTVWSFPERGSWATHNASWRGNWAPEVVRNLILRYSKEGDHLLDCMVGGGTSAIEAKILNRHITCIDINEKAIDLTKKMLDFQVDNNSKQRIIKCDARNMNFIKNDEIDFILTHPPYADIIKYSDENIIEDLSNIHNLEEFSDEIEKVAVELYRVLKKDHYCAILIGDTRRKGMYQPLAYKVMVRFMKQGFKLKEDIIKEQHNCKATGFWAQRSKNLNFLLIMHEHLFIFKK